MCVFVQDYTNERLHAVRIKVLPQGSVKFEVSSFFLVVVYVVSWSKLNYL